MTKPFLHGTGKILCGKEAHRTVILMVNHGKSLVGLSLGN